METVLKHEYAITREWRRILRTLGVAIACKKHTEMLKDELLMVNKLHIKIL